MYLSKIDNFLENFCEDDNFCVFSMSTSAVILSKSAAISIRGSQTFWEIVSRFLGKKNFLGRPQETTGDQKLLVKKSSKIMKYTHKIM